MPGDFLVIRKRDLPHSGAGRRVPGVATLTVRAEGQLVFSKSASIILGDQSRLLVALFAEDTRVLSFIGVQQPPSDMEESDCFPVHRNKNMGIWVSGGALMSYLGYEYKANGTRIFELEIAKERVMFVLPKGVMDSSRRSPAAQREVVFDQ